MSGKWLRINAVRKVAFIEVQGLKRHFIVFKTNDTVMALLHD